jgi:hypothetical protein
VTGRGCNAPSRTGRRGSAQADFIGKIRLFGVKLPTSILASAAFLKI